MSYWEGTNWGEDMEKRQRETNSQKKPESPSPALPIKEEEKTLGQILKEARQNKGLTTGKVLYETGVSEEYLRKLEADELKTPSAGVLWKLSQLYSLDLKPLAIKAGIIIKKPPSPAPIEQEKKEDWFENGHLIADVTQVMRDADVAFETVGGGTRHYVRDLLLPMLDKAGLKIRQLYT
jgi:transcriptional regulator with XRE-family HTH domain